MINAVQRNVVELMKLSDFNNFDGDEVSRDLEEHPQLWDGFIWGRFQYYELIFLRDITDGYANLDTLMVLTGKENVQRLRELARKWQANEFHEITELTPEDEIRERFGGRLPEGKTILRIWWD